MRNNFIFGAAVLAAAMLAGCGGGGGSNGPAAPGAGNLGPHFVTDIPVNNVSAAQAFSFDLGYVDQGKNAYYVTDRDNATVDKVTYNGGTGQNIVLAGFVGGSFGAGCRTAAGAPTSCNSASNGNSGPNGLNGIPGTASLYAGDVASVVVLNSQNLSAIVKRIPASSPVNPGADLFRVDEGCFLPPGGVAGNAFGIMAFATPDESPATYTFVRTDTNVVIGQLVLNNSSGIEACQIDATTGKMYYNDDGDLVGPNPSGALDSIDLRAAGPFLPALAAGPVSAVNGYRTLTCAAGGVCAVAGYARVVGYDVLRPAIPCGPAGLALNTTNNVDVAVSCRPPLGFRGSLLVLNRNTGALVNDVLAGLADQTAYDPVSNAYYMASSRWTPTGASPGSCAASPATRVCTPVLNIVNAATFAIVARVPTGNNAHSVDVDGANGYAFLPYSNSASPAGCGNCAANNFVNGGISVFAIR